MEDEVHDLHRRVDHAHALGRAREGRLEKVVVELDDQFLLGGRVGQPLGAAADGGVELLQALGLAVDLRLVQPGNDALHCA